MGGFVSFSDDRAWAMNNAVWRAVIHPVRDVLLEGSEPRLILEHAIRPGIHYLDLGGRLPSDVATIRDAIAQVRGRYAAGELRWGTEEETKRFLVAVDALLRMFDEPEFGRPMWPPPAPPPAER